MPKHGFLTAKAVGNRIKAKGLQRLRWYCQMCEKQMRDENGFKCHIKTEGHIRQMKLFAENPDKMITEFSRDFQKGFLDQLHRFHGTKKILANRIYAEYIANKEHVHMNATRWSTLSEFVKYLGKESHCIVEETEKGWYVQYIDRDPALIEKAAAFAAKQKEEVDNADRQRVMMENQIAALKAQGADDGTDTMGGALVRNEGPDIKIKIGFSTAPVSGLGLATKNKPRSLLHMSAVAESYTGTSSSSSSSSSSRCSSSGGYGAGGGGALEALMQEDIARKATDLRREDTRLREQFKQWLHTGTTVRVVNKDVVGGSLYKCKAVVDKTIADGFGAECTVDVEGTSVRAVLDQDDLETTIPKVGKPCLVVRGVGRGHKATMLAIRKADFQCDVRLDTGPHKGTTLSNREYEDVCRLV